MKGHAEAVIAWCLTLVGLKKRVQATLSEMVEADLAVAGAVARAYTLHDAEAYACELERQGEVALAAEVRRQVSLLVPMLPAGPGAGSLAALSRPTPPTPPTPAPPPALPHAGPVKRKPGRPPKSPPSSPPAPSQGATP